MRFLSFRKVSKKKKATSPASGSDASASKPDVTGVGGQATTQDGNDAKANQQQKEQPQLKPEEQIKTSDAKSPASCAAPDNTTELETDAKLANVLRQVRILAEGIDEKEDMSTRDVTKLKKALMSVVDEKKVSPAEAASARAVCDFMILDSMEECLILWFGKSQETDDRIWADFSEDVAKASMGLYEHWSYAVDHPHMIVALVILLDQFRRNMYRGTRGMYTCDAMCAGYVKRALQAKVDEHLAPKEMIFLLLNLTHSEELEDQHLCFNEYLKLEQKLSSDDPLRVFREIFKRHVDVIEKFNRFPHRNCIYQRKNTPEEEEFLADSTFRFDLPVVKTKEGGFKFFRDGKMLWKSAKKGWKEYSAPKLYKVVQQVTKKQYEDLYGKDDDEGHAESKFYFDDPDAHRMAIEQQKFLRIGDTAPDFTIKSTKGLLNLYEYLGDSWGIIFSHPKDFTPVCTTELGRAAQLQDEFDKRNVKLLAVSVDLIKDHETWTKDIEEVSGAHVDYPIVEDKHRKIAMQYGMLDQDTLDLKGALSITIRSVFVIDPKKKVKLILSYPVPTGRNFDEILRVVEALQTNWEYGVATPADWKRGQPTVVLPFYTDEEAMIKFKTIDKKTAYLRFTPDPGVVNVEDDAKVAEEKEGFEICS